MRNSGSADGMRGQAGFSLVDIMMVTCIMGIISSMAVFQLSQSRPAIQADGGMRVVMAQLNTARELAITQRRQMQVIFVDPNRVQIIRQELANNQTTVLSDVSIEGGVQYALVSGVPDTPDAFGIGSAKYFGTATKTLFGTDGMLIDQSGNPANGTISLAIPAFKRTSRAVTVLGSTGRVRGYKWDGRQWVLV